MKYAYFDELTRKVLGWIDTDAFSYDSLPSKEFLLELDATEWDSHADSDRWVGLDMVIVSAEPDTPQKIERVRTLKLSEISAACASEITSGFECSALGDVYKYPSASTDQANLTASVLASVLTKDPEWSTPFWCYDADGVGAFVSHTAVQIQAVGTTGIAAINAILARKGALEYQIQQAHTVTEIDAVRW